MTTPGSFAALLTTNAPCSATWVCTARLAAVTPSARARIRMRRERSWRCRRGIPTSICSVVAPGRRWPGHGPTEPVVLGGGKKLFPDDGTMRALELVEHKVASTGVHICTYRPDA